MSSVMNRRKSIELIAAGLSPILLHSSNTIMNVNINREEWLKNFMARWNNTQTYCFEIFNTMPLLHFNFKPNSDVFSFAKLFTHIGNGLNIYSGVLVGTSLDNEPETSDISEISDYLNNAFKNFNYALTEINLENLYTISHYKSEEEPWKEFTTFDIITLGYNHTVHHIAQATVYLRLNNVVPPQYRF